jgi:hypothetical protein
MSTSPEVKPSERYWGGSYDFEWCGTFADAFKKADIFHKFNDQDMDALAQVAARAVISVQQDQCDSVMNLRPGVVMYCGEPKGHPGRHRDRGDG